LVSYDYPGAPLIFELRGLPGKPELAANMPLVSEMRRVAPVERMDEYRKLSVGNVIECEGGYIIVQAKDYSLAQAFDREGKLLKEFKGNGNHYENFIEAVRSRKASQLNAPIIEGHVSSALSHLANISYRTGRQVRVNEIARKLSGQKAVEEAFTRLTEHLGHHGVQPGKGSLREGAKLTIDAEAQSFTGDGAAAANRLLEREYRKPFVVPSLG
jgi:hypothetical protein